MSVAEMYREGDVVRLTKGDVTIQGPVSVAAGFSSERSYIDFIFDDVYLDNAVQFGWTLEIVKRAPTPIPTKPGIYRDTEGDFWVLSDEEWTLYEVGYKDAHPYPEDGYFPLTRLEEVNE